MKKSQSKVQLIQLGRREKASKARLCSQSRLNVENLGKLLVYKVQTLELELRRKLDASV